MPTRFGASLTDRTYAGRLAACQQPYPQESGSTRSLVQEVGGNELSLSYGLTLASECYIYSGVYDMKKFKALLDNVPRTERFYTINPAFFKGLEVKTP